MTTHSISSRDHSVSSRDSVFAGPYSAIAQPRRFFEIFREWRRRSKSRAELCRFHELDLKDIGYPARVAAERAKPFWRE